MQFHHLWKMTILDNVNVAKYVIVITFISLLGCTSSLPEAQITMTNKRIVKPLPSIFRTKPSPLSRADSSHMAGIVLDYYLQAKEFQLRDQHDEAIKVYKRILHLDTSAMIFYSMGISYYELLKTDLAIESMKTAIALDPSLTIAREALAELYVNHEQYEEALMTYKTLDSIQSNPQYIYALAGLTEFLYPEQSEKYFKTLINSTGYDTDIVKRFGMLLIRLGKEQQYIELMREHYAIHSENAHARSLLIEALQLYGEMDEAFSMIEEFLPSALDEELEEYYQSILMNILSRKDSLFNAEIIQQHLSKLSTYPINSWIVQISAGLLAEHTKDSTSEYFHKQALKIADSNHLKQSIGLAYELMRLEYNDLFTSHCKRYAEHYPKESRFHFLLGIHAREEHQSDQAKSYFTESLRRNPDEADAWAELAGVFGQEKFFPASDSCFKEALRIDSLNPMYNNNYAYSLSERNEQLNEALRMSLLAISQYPDNQSFQDTYAWIQFKLGNPQSAIDILNKALMQDMDRSGIIHYHLSIIHDSLSENEKALFNIKKAIEIRQDPDYQAQLEKLLRD